VCHGKATGSRTRAPRRQVPALTLVLCLLLHRAEPRRSQTAASTSPPTSEASWTTSKEGKTTLSTTSPSRPSSTSAPGHTSLHPCMNRAQPKCTTHVHTEIDHVAPNVYEHVTHLINDDFHFQNLLTANLPNSISHTYELRFHDFFFHKSSKIVLYQIVTLFLSVDYFGNHLAHGTLSFGVTDVEPFIG